MKNVFIIHGSFGNPEENWIPWLKKQCEEKGYTVTVPAFPCDAEQNYNNWMQVMESYLPDFNEETIVVGHSIGPAFTLSILEKLSVTVKRTILVSGFLGALGNETFDAVNLTISGRDFLWGKINQNSEKFSILHGSNDPYVPISKAKELGILLDTEPIIIPNGGHLNEEAGFIEFPLLLKLIED